MLFESPFCLFVKMGISGEFSPWLIFFSTLSSWLPWHCCDRKKRSMAIYSHRPECLAENLSIVIPQFVHLLFCETYFFLSSLFIPVFILVFTELISLWMWCEYTVELDLTDNALWLALSCLGWDVFFFSEIFDDRGPRRLKDKANRKIIFNFLSFYFHIIWADKYGCIFICLIIMAGVRSMC